MILLDGVKLAQRKKAILKEKIASLNYRPTLVIVQVGQNFASTKYINHKLKIGEEVGANAKLLMLPENTTEANLIQTVEMLNNDQNVDGFIVQLPLPNHIQPKTILKKVAIEKDVDGLSTMNAGHLLQSDEYIIPATPRGILELLHDYDISLSGKIVAVVGRSNIVGKPMGQLILKENGTLIMCHSKSDLSILENADVIISATGKAKLINHTMIRKGVVIVDVGMNKDEHGNLCGDVDFNDVKDYVSAITPVPGGVGPMTVISLFENLYILACKKQNKVL